ncbi:MAG: AIR synthase-related protein [Catonella sp.]|uniref:AIR synthase-related protein n=1 Tax=Catonella sp. TaxID=2382125 RepID=UPI003F9ECC96
MIEIPDYIYLRSVIKQLYLKEESRRLFQKNAYSVSITGKDEPAYSVEVSDFKSYKGKAVLKETDFNSILRKLLCAGGGLDEIRAEIVFSGGFNETLLREFSASLKKTADALGAEVKRVSVHLKEGSEEEMTVLLSGKGLLKKMSDAPWQCQKIFAGQEIILTGSLGRAGMIEIADKKGEQLKSFFPKHYMERIKSMSGDRLPFIEMDAVPFYRATAMLSLEEGGLLAGLWNLGERDGAGLRVYSDRLFFEQETIELCNYFDINPLELNSRGAYLIATDRGEELTYVLRKAGLNAVCIGNVIKEKKRVIVFEDEERFIESPKYNCANNLN